MERANLRECPKCKSRDIIYLGGMGYLLASGPAGEDPGARYPLFECKNCGEIFMVLEKERDSVDIFYQFS